MTEQESTHPGLALQPGVCVAEPQEGSLSLSRATPSNFTPFHESSVSLISLFIPRGSAVLSPYL